MTSNQVPSLRDADFTLRLPRKEAEHRIAVAQRRILQLRLQLGGKLGNGRLGPPVCFVFEGWDAWAHSFGQTVELHFIIAEPGRSPTLEEGDPIDVVALSDVADAVGAGSMVDWEQPAIADPPQAPSTPELAPLRTAPAPPAPWPTASVAVAVIEQDQNLLQILRDPDKPWLGY